MLKAFDELSKRYSSLLSRIIECSDETAEDARCYNFTFDLETKGFLKATRREAEVLYNNFKASWLTFDATMAWLGITLALSLLMLSIAVAVHWN